MPVGTSGTDRTGVFHRESTRLRSNVADQVQRDLLPAGRMLSVFLVLCELLAEVAVLLWSRGEPCDRPLRFWVAVLIMLQAGTVVLNCLNIWNGRDSFGQHRNGLSASDMGMYTDGGGDDSDGSEIIVNVLDGENASSSMLEADRVVGDTQPLIDGEGGADRGSRSMRESREGARSRSPIRRNLNVFRRTAGSSTSSTSSIGSNISTEFVDRYVRIVNGLYLIWFIFGSVWVSDHGECSRTAPHLYRLVVALAIIYYALLFLPLACFCLIVCCLPLFILVYRIMLPYAERERRRARAADPVQVQNLSSIVYSPETFANYTSNASVEDASCVICLCEYEPNEIITFLPCKHHFHKDCVDVWLRLDKACCLCKQDIDAPLQPISSPV